MRERIHEGRLAEEIARGDRERRERLKSLARALVGVIREGLVRDGVVRIHGFGTFRLRPLKPRRGINPQTGERITIPARNRVMFRPAKALRERVEPEPAPAVPLAEPHASREASLGADGLRITKASGQTPATAPDERRQPAYAESEPPPPPGGTPYASREANLGGAAEGRPPSAALAPEDEPLPHGSRPGDPDPEREWARELATGRAIEPETRASREASLGTEGLRITKASGQTPATAPDDTRPPAYAETEPPEPPGGSREANLGGPAGEGPRSGSLPPEDEPDWAGDGRATEREASVVAAAMPDARRRAYEDLPGEAAGPDAAPTVRAPRVGPLENTGEAGNEPAGLRPEETETDASRRRWPWILLFLLALIGLTLWLYWPPAQQAGPRVADGGEEAATASSAGDGSEPAAAGSAAGDEAAASTAEPGTGEAAPDPSGASSGGAEAVGEGNEGAGAMAGTSPEAAGTEEITTQGAETEESLAEAGQGEPTQSESTQAESTQSESTQAGSTQAGSTQAGSAEAESAEAESAEAESAEAESAEAGSTQAGSTQAGSTQAGSGQAEATGTGASESGEAATTGGEDTATAAAEPDPGAVTAGKPDAASGTTPEGGTASAGEAAATRVAEAPRAEAQTETAAAGTSADAGESADAGQATAAAGQGTAGEGAGQAEGTPYFAGREYAIERGDTLWGLADTYYVNPFYWPHIWNHNGDIANPNRVEIDQQLWLPTLEGEPRNLTAADRRSIAEGYLRLYRFFQQEGDANPQYALVGVRYFDASVLPPELQGTAAGKPADALAAAFRAQLEAQFPIR